MSGVTVGPLGRTVAATIGRRRRAAGMSQAAVARAMTAAGRPIPRSALSDAELGVRRLDVDDLHAPAHVLGVTVTQLLPPAACEHCHGTPGPWTACLACGAEGPR